ncbi:MAG TPA: hypothetical protein DHN29_22260, partial [Cytophagales bacterium]|nr:hypothetical protein [Cytophagales bacterium]
MRAVSQLHELDELDSLTTLLRNETNDSIRVNHLLTLADYYRQHAYLQSSFSDSSIAYGRRALDLSQQSSFEQGVISSYKVLGLIMNNRGRMDSSELYFIKALTQLGESGDPAEKADIVTRLGVAYMYKEQAKADSAFALAFTMIDSTENTETNRFLYTNFGLFNLVVGDFPTALSYFQKAVQLAERVDDWVTFGNGLQYIGRVYREMGVMDRAIDFIDSSKSVLKKKGGIIDDASVNYELGVLHAQLEKPELEKSILYFKESLQVQKERGHQMNIANCYTALSIVHAMKGEPEIADSYLQEALTINLDLGNYNYVANTYFNQAKNNFLKKDYQESRSALKLFRQYADSAEISYSLRLDAMNLAVEVEEMLGNYRTANGYMKQLVQLKDSIFREDKSREIGRLESQYELDKANYNNEIKEQELQIKDAAINQQRLQRNALIIGLLLVGLLAFFAVRGQRAKSRLNQQLKKIEEIKTRWFVNVSHELKTPLTLIQGPINQLMKSESINDVDKTKLNLADRNVKSLQSLVLEILDLSKLEKGVLKLDSKPVDLTTLVKSTVASFESLAHSCKVDLSVEVEDQYWMTIDPNKVRKLVENLISNALKFTPEGGEVVLRLQ